MDVVRPKDLVVNELAVAVYTLICEFDSTFWAVDGLALILVGVKRNKILTVLTFERTTHGLASLLGESLFLRKIVHF